MSIPEVKTEIKHVDDMTVAIIRTSRRMEVLSSTVLNGGVSTSDSLIIIQVPADYDCHDPGKDIEKIIRELKLPEDTIGFMTAAEVEYVLSEVGNEYKGYASYAIVTAGLSNQVVAGDELTDWERRHALSQKRREALLAHAGTINIIGIVSEPLTCSAKVNAVITMTEAKTAALNDLGYKETGTTSDAVAILCPVDGKRQNYAGTGFGQGISLAQAVRSCVRKSLIKRNDFPEDMSESDIAALKEKYA